MACAPEERAIAELLLGNPPWIEANEKSVAVSGALVHLLVGVRSRGKVRRDGATDQRNGAAAIDRDVVGDLGVLAAEVSREAEETVAGERKGVPFGLEAPNGRTFAAAAPDGDVVRVSSLNAAVSISAESEGRVIRSATAMSTSATWAAEGDRPFRRWVLIVVLIVVLQGKS